MALAIGVDIGGTKVAGGLVDEDGAVVSRVRRNTPSLDPVATESTLAEVILELASRWTRSLRWASVPPASSTRTAPASGSRPTSPGARSRCASGSRSAPAFRWSSRTTATPPPGPRSGSGPAVARATSSWSASAPGSRAVWCWTARCTAAVGARPASGDTCGSSPRVARAGAGGAAAGSSTPAATRWFARPGSGPPCCRRRRPACSRTATGRAEGLTGPMITEAARAGDPLAMACFADVGRWLGRGIAEVVSVLDPGLVVDRRWRLRGRGVAPGAGPGRVRARRRRRGAPPARAVRGGHPRQRRRPGGRRRPRATAPGLSLTR